MKRFILAGLCCLLLAGCADTNPDPIPEEEIHLGEVLDQAGHSYSHVLSGSEMSAGFYRDGENWYITTVRYTGDGDTTVTDQPLCLAQTEDPDIQLWYGVCGSPEKPWLMLRLVETEPTCRSLGVRGEERSLELTNSLGNPVECLAEPLEGLADSENRLTVTLADMDLGKGLQPKSPYCEIPLDLTEALDEMQ